MNRDWSFNVTPALTWVSLWSLIVGDPSLQDLTFGNSPFVPSSVCGLFIQKQTDAPTLQISDSKLEAGQTIATGALYNRQYARNIIDLKNIFLRCSAIPCAIQVSINSI
jgi:hypothetical protein